MSHKNSKEIIINLKEKLFKFRKIFGWGFLNFFKKNLDEKFYEELEEKLIIADIGIDTTNSIINNLKIQVQQKKNQDSNLMYKTLKNDLLKLLKKVEVPLEIKKEYPFIILIIGVNGAGKTTTIGKLAHFYKKQNKSILLAAGDTFRAAAVEQLKILGNKNNVNVIAKEKNKDAASVIFDAINIAKKNKNEILIADTAGRLQNKSHLIFELKKIVKAIKKLNNDAPHEIILVIDATMGQNVITQTKLFHQAVGLTGLIITKLDGTAKGGIIFSLANHFNIPVRYLGVGEKMQDLHIFNAKNFINALFS